MRYQVTVLSLFIFTLLLLSGCSLATEAPNMRVIPSAVCSPCGLTTPASAPSDPWPGEWLGEVSR